MTKYLWILPFALGCLLLKDLPGLQILAASLLFLTAVILHGIR